MRIFYFVLLCLHVCAAENPAVKLRITKNGIAFVNQAAQALIEKELRSLSIPDQSGSEGRITYSFWNIRVTDIVSPTSNIHLNPQQNGLTWSLTNFDVKIHSDWRVKYKKNKWVKASTSGSVDAGFKRVSLVETVGFGIDNTGRPSVSSIGCSNSVGDVSIRFHGGISFILNIFKGVFEREIKKLIQGKVCRIVENAVNVNAAQELAKMKVNAPFARKFMIDYSLVQAPSITADYAELMDKGEVFWKEDRNECPFSPPPISALSDYNNMVYIWLTDYTANSFLHQAHTHGYLKYILTKTDLSKAQNSFLDTSCHLMCIGTIIPQIKEAYPNSDVQVHIKSNAVPRATFSTGNLTTSLEADVELWAHTADDKMFHMATLGVSAVLTGEAAVKEERLTGSIIGHKLEVSLTKSEIGPIKTEALNYFLVGALDFAVVPMLNEMAKRGVDLPITDLVKFQQTKLSILEGALLISTDFQHKGSCPDCDNKPLNNIKDEL